MTRDRAAAERRGRRGETMACWWLRLHGWHILAQRVRVRGGEIDIVARRGNTLACVEVKWRATAAERDFALDAWRLRRVARAAEVVAHRYARDGENLRLDAILLAPGQWPRHLKGLIAD